MGDRDCDVSLNRLELLQQQVLAEERLVRLPEFFDLWARYLQRADGLIERIPELGCDEVQRVGTESIEWLQKIRNAHADRQLKLARDLIHSGGRQLRASWQATNLGSIENEVWAISRDRYLRDYLSAFWKLGYNVRWIERTAAEVCVKAGLRPIAILDSNVFAGMLSLAEAHEIPFIGLPLDQWVRSQRHAEVPHEPTEPLRHLHLPNLLATLDQNFPLDGSSNGRQHSYLFPVGPEQVDLFGARRVPHVEQMHFGVDTARFLPMELSSDETQRYGAAVTFIGDSLISNPANGYHVLANRFRMAITSGDAAWKKHWFDQWELLERLMERQEPSYGRFVLHEALPELERESGVDFLEPGDTPFKESWLNLIGYEVSRRQRQQMAERIAPLGLAIYGDPEWRRVQAVMPHVDYRGEADWDTELPKIINAAPIHINVSKIMFPTGVGPRVFETLACSRLLISNRIPAIEGLFEEDREIVYFDTIDELKQKVRYYQEHESEAETIAARGCEKVRSEHSMAHRVKRIVESAGLQAVSH